MFFVRLKFNSVGFVDYLQVITYSSTLLYGLKMQNFLSFLNRQLHFSYTTKQICRTSKKNKLNDQL